MKVVIDASVAVKWYLPEAYSEESIALLKAAEPLLVPEVLVAQVGSVLSRRVRAGEIKADYAERAVGNLLRLPLRRVPTAVLAQDAIGIASTSARSFTEALYFALAAREGTKLVTADHRWYTLLATGPLRPYVTFVSEAVQTASGAPATQSPS